MNCVPGAQKTPPARPPYTGTISGTCISRSRGTRNKEYLYYCDRAVLAVLVYTARAALSLQGQPRLWLRLLPLGLVWAAWPARAGARVLWRVPLLIIPGVPANEEGCFFAGGYPISPAYDVGQDVVEALIDAAEYKCCPVLDHAYNFGRYRASLGSFLA